MKKEDFIIDDWYMANNDTILCFQGGGKGYGLNSMNHWVVSEDWSFMVSPTIWKPVNGRIVVSRLLDYARKRYPLGTKHNGYNDDIELEFPFTRKRDPEQFKFKSGKSLTNIGFNEIFSEDEAGCIYNNGKWADREQDWVISKKETTSFKYMMAEDDEIKVAKENKEWSKKTRTIVTKAYADLQNSREIPKIITENTIQLNVIEPFCPPKIRVYDT